RGRWAMYRATRAEIIGPEPLNELVGGRRGALRDLLGGDHVRVLLARRRATRGATDSQGNQCQGDESTRARHDSSAVSGQPLPLAPSTRLRSHVVRLREGLPRTL